MKETTRATYARAYTRPYQKTGTGKLKLTGNLYGTGRSVHRPFNYRSPPVFLNGRVRCTDRTGELFFDAYCTSYIHVGQHFTSFHYNYFQIINSTKIITNFTSCCHQYFFPPFLSRTYPPSSSSFHLSPPSFSSSISFTCTMTS